MVETLATRLEKLAEKHGEKVLLATSREIGKERYEFDPKTYCQLVSEKQALEAAMIACGIEIQDTGLFFLDTRPGNLDKLLPLTYALMGVGGISVLRDEEPSFLEVEVISSEVKPQILFLEDEATLERVAAARKQNFDGIKKVVILNPDPKKSSRFNFKSRVISYNTFMNAGQGIVDKDENYLNERKNSIQECADGLIASIVYTFNGLAPVDKAFKAIGVAHTYSSLLSLIEYIGKYITFNSGDCIVSGLPMSHIFGFSLPFIAAEHELILLNDTRPDHFNEYEELDKKNLLFAGVPYVWDFFARRLTRIGFIRDFVKKNVWKHGNVRCIGAGAISNQKSIEQLRRVFPDYTEIYGLSAFPLVAIDKTKDGFSRFVGVAPKDVEVKVVEWNYGNFVEKDSGEVGDIIVKGKFMMKGYYAQETINDQYFVNGWLYTGDKGKLVNREMLEEQEICLPDPYTQIGGEPELYLLFEQPEGIVVPSKGTNLEPSELERQVLQQFFHEKIKHAVFVGNGCRYPGMLCYAPELRGKGKLKLRSLEGEIKKYILQLKDLGIVHELLVPKKVKIITEALDPTVVEIGPDDILIYRRDLIHDHKDYSPIIQKICNK